jgi:methylenetetrahydrofolate reductase (NADPH)
MGFARAMTALPIQQTPIPDSVARIAGFMQNFSVEATRPSDADIAALAVLPRGTRVYISAVPHRPAEESIDAAIRLRAAGLEPVPHVAVRNFASVDALDDFLARLNGEAEVRRVLVIAGDRGEHGPFRSAAYAIDSGLFRRRGIRALGIAGYPEGHPKIGNDALFKALAEKIAAAEATGLAVEIVTQFCFNARAIFDYVARLRGFGFEQPLRIGLVGPTSFAALMRYAARCGVRASAQALAHRSGMLRQNVRADHSRRSHPHPCGSRAVARERPFLLVRRRGGHRALGAGCRRWPDRAGRSGQIHGRIPAAGRLISPP